ncbi:MAG TPA: Re/Si-specific NAD(P)(+) transhydrogenase subunit beta, partial [Clostridiales bacterium]|nr:Re/Si-specific NAD(P)(+) transhydrogenase subunit beta [Clostridiales bacterium]
MSQGLVTVAYIIAALLFILALAGLSQQETARRGNIFGICGMIIALAATLTLADPKALPYILIAAVIAALIGVRVALKVEMTGMPELIAALHSFVGMAAVFVGFNSFFKLQMGIGEPLEGAMLNIELVEIFVGVFIGAITFTGSVVAFGKLRGIMKSRALTLPGKNFLNILCILVFVVTMVLFLMDKGATQASFIYLLVMTIVAFLLGLHLVASIGGADMPVVISMLNSYSGWATAAAGFMLSNDAVIVTGALVGSSGA